MSIHWTKRPQNVCRSCGYSWYPRGKDVSAKCPSCGSPRVELAITAFLRALGYLLAAPFVLLAIAARLLFHVGKAIAKLIWAGASDVAEHTEPTGTIALDWVMAAAKHCLVGLLFPAKWLYSVKDDLLTEEDRDVNPVTLIAKLLLIVGISACAIIGAINVFH